MPDAFNKLKIETEFLILAIKIKLAMKKEIVNAGNKIFMGNLHKKKKNKICKTIAAAIKKLLDTYSLPLNFICGNNLNKT